MNIPQTWRLKRQRLCLEGTVCPNCGLKSFPPRPNCPHCAALNQTSEALREFQAEFVVASIAMAVEA